jgi:hypothetical protein
MLAQSGFHVSAEIDSTKTNLYIGPSGMRALSLAAGINEGGHYWSEQRASDALGSSLKHRWPLFLIFYSTLVVVVVVQLGPSPSSNPKPKPCFGPKLTLKLSQPNSTSTQVGSDKVLIRTTSPTTTRESFKARFRRPRGMIFSVQPYFNPTR